MNENEVEKEQTVSEFLREEMKHAGSSYIRVILETMPNEKGTGLMWRRFAVIDKSDSFEMLQMLDPEIPFPKKNIIVG
jgi:hypothetical protein